MHLEVVRGGEEINEGKGKMDDVQWKWKDGCGWSNGDSCGRENGSLCLHLEAMEQLTMGHGTACYVVQPIGSCSSNHQLPM